jgi:hypothetical protein
MLERSEVNRCDVTLLAGNAVFALLVAAAAAMSIVELLRLLQGE